MGDKKLWLIARYFVQKMETIFEPLIAMVQENPTFKQAAGLAKWSGREVKKAWRFYQYYFNEFQKIMDKLLAEALAALKKVWDTGYELPQQAWSEVVKAKADLKGLVVLGSTKLGELKDAAFDYVWDLIPGLMKRQAAITTGPTDLLRPYNVLSVCGMLGITESAFDNLKDKKMVKYVKENPLNGFELLYVLHYTHRELTPRLRF